jgi:hypothetical protein
MWFTFVTARLFIFLSFQPRLAATLLRSCSVVNNLTRRVGLSPTFLPTSLAQPLISFDLAGGGVKFTQPEPRFTTLRPPGLL